MTDLDLTLDAKDMNYVLFTIGIGFSLLILGLKTIVEREVFRRHVVCGGRVGVRNINFPVVGNFFYLFQFGFFKGTMPMIFLVLVAGLSPAGTYFMERSIKYRSISALLRKQFKVGNPVLPPILKRTLSLCPDVRCYGHLKAESKNPVVTKIVSSGVSCYKLIGTSLSVGLTAMRSTKSRAEIFCGLAWTIVSSSPSPK